MGKSFPGAAYQEQINVYDCSNPFMAIAEDFIFDETGELLYHYKWGDPKYLNISVIGFAIRPGSVGFAGRNIVCDDALGRPLASKKQMANMNFISLSSMVGGDGEIFYGPAQKSQSDPHQREVTIMLKLSSDRNVNATFPAGVSISDPPNYRQELDRLLIKCDTNKFAIIRTEYWNALNQLVRMQFADPLVNPTFSDFMNTSPFAAMQEIFCQKDYAGVGIRLVNDNGSIVAAEVFEGSPAAKAGVAANDVISYVDNEPVSGLTPQQVTEKIRGPTNTRVVLKVLRKGQNDPVELPITREIVKMKSVEGASK